MTRANVQKFALGVAIIVTASAINRWIDQRNQNQ